MRITARILVLMLLAACTDFPEVDAAMRGDIAQTPYPQLVPIQQVLDAPALPRVSPESGEELQSQADRLRARAARLRAIPTETVE